MLTDGCYQAFIAYTENEQRVSDYIGISNLQTIWNHDDNSCGLDISVSETNAVSIKSIFISVISVLYNPIIFLNN